MKSIKLVKESTKEKNPPQKIRTLGPVSDLERHLPTEWWRTLFNSIYLKTDGDVVENNANTIADIDLLISSTGITESDELLDVCCGQGRHSLELAKRGFRFVNGVDRSRYLIRLARKRAKEEGFKVQFSEGDARKIRQPEKSKDCVFLMGNSFGYFENEEDDLAVLESIRRILRSQGKLVLDIVDGEWMAKNFEPRSWEWIDQQHFVNRERTLASDSKRIITREVVTNAEIGTIADQFYAERLYLFEEIYSMLSSLGFTNITNVAKIKSESTRGQDLGMMAHRMFITCVAPEKKVISFLPKSQKPITVVMGDPRLPDNIKNEGKFTEADMLTIKKLKNTLAEIDYLKIDYLDNHKTLLKQLINEPPCFVFNLCDEGYNNNPQLELHIPAILEMLGIPYSGAAPGCLALCYNKAKVSAIAANVEVPTPLETYFSPSDQAAYIPSTFPAFLKPACGDCSVGITKNSVVHNANELVDYLHYLREILPGVGVLVQEYLQGSEYTVNLIGNPPNLDVLPILEVDYTKLSKNLPKILTYESKTDSNSEYWQEISYKIAEIDEDLRNKLISYSKTLFEATECRDYARFDFRCDSQGNPKLLEVNPNPCWGWVMASFAGIPYKELLDKIIKAAFERYNL